MPPPALPVADLHPDEASYNAEADKSEQCEKQDFDQSLEEVFSSLVRAALQSLILDFLESLVLGDRGIEYSFLETEHSNEPATA